MDSVRETNKLSEATVSRLREMINHPDIWPDVKARAERAIQWHNGEVGYNALTNRIKSGLRAGKDPRSLLAGHRASWIKVPAIRLRPADVQELKTLVSFPDPELPPKHQAAQSSHAKLLLELAERPVDWKSPRERKMMQALNHLEPVDAAHPIRRSEALSPQSGVSESWKPTKDDALTVAQLRREVKAGQRKFNASQSRRLEAIALMVKGKRRDEIAELTGYSLSTLRHLAWDCATHGVRSSVASSYKK